MHTGRQTDRQKGGRATGSGGVLAVESGSARKSRLVPQIATVSTLDKREDGGWGMEDGRMGRWRMETPSQRDVVTALMLELVGVADCRPLAARQVQSRTLERGSQVWPSACQKVRCKIR